MFICLCLYVNGNFSSDSFLKVKHSSPGILMYTRPSPDTNTCGYEEGPHLADLAQLAGLGCRLVVL